MHHDRSSLQRTAALSLFLLATAAPACAASYNEATWVQTTYADDGAMTDWYLYRNTVVSLVDGRATCLLPPGTTDARAGCHQVPSQDPAFLGDLVIDRVLAGATMRCGSGAYVAAWQQVPANDPSHWCNAFPAEALTVRVRVGGAGVESKGALTWNLSSDGSWGIPILAFVVPPQPVVIGPTDAVWHEAGPTRVTATLRNARTQSLEQVELAVSKHAGCAGPLSMHSVDSCTGTNQLEVVFDPKDNLHLPTGRFIGSFEVVAVDGAAFGALQTLVFNVDISKQ